MFHWHAKHLIISSPIHACECHLVHSLCFIIRVSVAACMPKPAPSNHWIIQRNGELIYFPVHVTHLETRACVHNPRFVRFFSPQLRCDTKRLCQMPSSYARPIYKQLLKHFPLCIAHKLQHFLNRSFKLYELSPSCVGSRYLCCSPIMPQLETHLHSSFTNILMKFVAWFRLTLRQIAFKLMHRAWNGHVSHLQGLLALDPIFFSTNHHQTLEQVGVHINFACLDSIDLVVRCGFRWSNTQVIHIWLASFRIQV